jgi:hypothetical protein
MELNRKLPFYIGCDYAIYTYNLLGFGKEITETDKKEIACIMLALKKIKNLNELSLRKLEMIEYKIGKIEN